ncbi:hypothetical protein Pelo_18585 [Pelomyxa schiedti]|nr:hypothetical protein Pelo_18585 [Pelomyxa schiedti]
MSHSSTARQGQPTIVVHLSARDQFVALATSSHHRCGAHSPASLMTSQPALLVQLWDFLTTTTTVATSTFGVVVSARNCHHNTLTSFCVSTLLGSICCPSCWPWRPSSSPVSVIEWDHNKVLAHKVAVVPVTKIPETSTHESNSEAEQSRITASEPHRARRKGMIGPGVFEKVTPLSGGTCFWLRLRLPSLGTEVGEGSSKANDVLIHQDTWGFDAGSANSKWAVHSCVGLQGFKLIRLSDWSGKRITETPQRAERASALTHSSLLSVFFNQSNEDEAVMVEDDLTMVVVDLAVSFLTGFARVLSETSWAPRRPGDSAFFQNVLVFDDEKHSGKRLLIVLIIDGHRKVIVREEGTASWNTLICENALRGVPAVGFNKYPGRSTEEVSN